MTGTITRVMLPRGFGFIVGDDGIEYFLHVDDLIPGIIWDGTVVRNGVRVQFEPYFDEAKKKGSGWRAVKTAVLKE